MRFSLITGLLLVVAPRASAYVDLATTLSRTVIEAQTISVVEVEKFSREKGAVLLTNVRDLKGKTPAGPVRQLVARTPGMIVPRVILEWAEPGRRAVLFSNASLALVCVGRGWYQLHPSADGWWRLGPDRPDMPLAYYGSVSRLETAVEAMLAGKPSVITTVAHGSDNEGASFDLALNRTALPGLARIQRLKADLRMPGNVMAVANNPAWFIGAGPAGEDEIPSLIKSLQSPGATTRAEAAEDLRWLASKPAASVALEPLTTLLKDSSPIVRSSAAAAVLRYSPKSEAALAVLLKELSSENPAARRHAARSSGLAGSAAVALVPNLVALLTDTDEIARVLSLQAIATLGADAAPAHEAVAKLLDDPAMAIDAADALGRIGAAARPANPQLAKMLLSDQPTVRWAAVRAMSQIGGDSASPAVDYIIKVLKANPTEVDGYNSMIYLGLLGPVAKPAIPTIESTRIKNPVLGQYAMWSMEPETRFPWLGAGGGGRGFGGGGGMRDAEFARWIGESFLRETGDRFKPAAGVLAGKILDGSAGELPWIGSRLLTKFPEAAIEKLTPALASGQLQMRERATVALGQMGKSAAPALGALEGALKKSTNAREQKLIQWAIRQMGAK